MKWEVDFHDDFVSEFESLDDEVQDELLALIERLEELGPYLSRPRADTLKGSRHANMKELWFDAAQGVWRFAFAFDPGRKAFLFCGGNKADARFDAHLSKMKKTGLAREKR